MVMEKFSWTHFFIKNTSRQWLGFILACVLVSMGKELNWAFFAVYMAFVIGDKIDTYKDLAKSWLDKK
jgi:hypothetical protein